MRILVVEDERKLAKFVQRAFREEGHAVDLSHDGEEGGLLAIREDYDVIVLDLQLPRRDGLRILRDLREKKKGTPVIVLSSRDSVKDRVKGLEIGADDYLTKPFSIDELRARVRVLLRRSRENTSALLRFADVALNLVDRRVQRGAREVPLTAKEFSLLEYFLRNPGRVLSRTSIAEHVWDYGFEWESNVIEVFINALRKKLEEGGEPRLIQTLRGAGYVLREPADAGP